MGRYAELLSVIDPDGRQETCFELINLMPGSDAADEMEACGDPFGVAIASTLVPEIYDDPTADQEELFALILGENETRRMIRDAFGVLLAEKRLPKSQLRLCADLLGVEEVAPPKFSYSALRRRIGANHE